MKTASKSYQRIKWVWNQCWNCFWLTCSAYWGAPEIKAGGETHGEPLCSHIGPNQLWIFSAPGNKMPTHCKSRKTAAMPDVCHPQCRCGAGASFAAPGSKKRTHCASCKTADIVRVDGRKCPCGKTASFAAPGSKKRTHCASCKTADMVSMVIKKKAWATAGGGVQRHICQ